MFSQGFKMNNMYHELNKTGYNVDYHVIKIIKKEFREG